MGQIDLDLRPDVGERTAQFVRGVGDEALLSLLRSLESIEHCVHGPGQTPDLVIDRRFGDAAMKTSSADLGDLRPNRLDRRERSPHDEPHQATDEQDERGHGEEQGAIEDAAAVADALEALRNVDDIALAIGVDPLGDDAKRVVVDRQILERTELAAAPPGRTRRRAETPP